MSAILALQGKQCAFCGEPKVETIVSINLCRKHLELVQRIREDAK